MRNPFKSDHSKGVKIVMNRQTDRKSEIVTLDSLIDEQYGISTQGRKFRLKKFNFNQETPTFSVIGRTFSQNEF